MKCYLKLLVFSLLFAVLAFTHAYASSPDPGSRPEATYKEGELLVKFNPGVPGTERINAHARAGASIIREFPSLGIHHVALAKGQSVEEAISIYSRNPNIEYAEPNYIVSAEMFPSDPEFDQLWGLHNTGQTGGNADADIDAPEAWDITQGISNTVVAVIDTGIDYNHEDLASNMWVNAAEYNGSSGVDDDSNGYIDDVYGIDTYNHDTDPMDDHSHGTHVAGTIGASGSNGVGVSGVNWNINILACKFIGSNGYGDIAGAVECLTYIASLKNSGENIMATNNSWSSSEYSQSLKDAIDAQRDILLFAAAANNYTNNDLIPRYPANYYLPNVIAVTATNSSDGQVYNYGRRSVHLGGPGYGIYSTLPGNSYGSNSGTSMATPHVTGVAALLKAQDENRDWRAIKNLVLSGGDSIASMDATTITGKRLNAYGSLGCVDAPVFSTLQYPLYPQTGVPETLSALSINCQWPVGPVTATADGSTVIGLYDDGIDPDIAAGDGIFTGTWVPQTSAPQILDFSSPAGADSIEVNPVAITNTTVAPPALEIDTAASSCKLVDYYSQSFGTSGGLGPFTWAVESGSLPGGLIQDSVTGEISGTPTTPGSFSFVIRVVDSANEYDTLDYTIVVHQDIRPGYPLELQKRVGYGGLPVSFSPIFADLDNDGSQEIVVADKETLYVFDSAGLVDKVMLPATVSTPSAADLDGDNDLEIIVAVNYPSTNPPIYAFHHDLSPVAGFPAGTYPTYTGSPGYLYSAVIEDLDGNGSPEIVVLGSPNFSLDPNDQKAILVVIDSSGSTLSGWPLVIDDMLTMGYPTGLAVGDLDGNGTKEIVYVSRYNIVYVLGMDGTVEQQWSVAPDFSVSYGVFIADVDSNGSQNIIVRYNTSSATTAIVVFDNTGGIIPGWPQTFPADYTNNGLAIADLDGDGSLELVVPISNKIHVLQYNGSPFPGWPIQVLWWPGLDCHPVAGDINGDGQPEILINTGSWNNNSGGVFAFTSSGTSVSGYPKYTTPDNEIRTTPALGDLDNDLKVDVAVKSEDGMLYVWEAPQQSDSISLSWPMYMKDETHTSAIPTGVFEIWTSSLSDGMVASAYSVGLNARFGLQPYTWAITAGALPDGLTLDSASGVISGTPSTSGTSNFTVQATDANLNSVTKDLSITVYDPLAVTTSSLPYGITGQTYSQGLSASGGLVPYTWAVTAGALPDGLSLDGATGVISGIPSVYGLFEFTIEATDTNSEAASQSLSIAIGATTTYYVHTASGCGQATYTRGPEYATLGTVSGDCATEDTMQWPFRGGPRDMLIGYLANSGYASDTTVQGMPAWNNLSFLSGSDGTATVSLAEVNPSDGMVVQVLSTVSVHLSAGVQTYVTDVSGLTGIVTSGNTVGIVLSMESASRVDNEIRWGRTGGGPGLEQWFTITEVPQGIAPPPGNNPPVANANGPYSGTVDNPVLFSSIGSFDPDGDPVTYLWDFGDGNTSTQANPTHVYTAANTYTVTLTVTDSLGAESQDTTTADITSGGGGGNQPPVADAGADKTAQVRENIVFDGSVSYDPDGTITSYSWDFGDGKTGTGSVITHKFSKSGTYTVTLTVTDNEGATANDTAVVTVSN